MSDDAFAISSSFQPSAADLPFLPRWRRHVSRFARSKPLSAGGAVVVLTLVTVAILAPLLAPANPISNSADILVGPSGDHLFGTDRFGRDVFSRTLFGARISLMVGFVSLTIGIAIGTLLGLLSGYLGGAWDMTIQRVMDSLLAFPYLVLAMAIVSMLGNSVPNVIGAIGVLFIPNSSRVIRSAVLSIRSEPFVDAARVLGCSAPRIIFRHILPNVIAPIIVLMTVGLGNAIIIEASLSFLGLGTPPPAASWGRDLADTRAWWTTSTHLFWPPAVAISLAVFGFNLLGDGLRDVLDPRLRTR